MGLTADIYDIFGFTNHVISEAAALQASITDVTTAVNHFAALLDNQSGATVVSMRNYITGFASSIQAIADAVNMAFTQILMVYQGAYALLIETHICGWMMSLILSKKCIIGCVDSQM